PGSICRSAIVHEDTFFSVELPSLEARTHPILPFSLPVCHWILRHCLHFCLFQQTEQLYGTSYLFGGFALTGRLWVRTRPFPLISLSARLLYPLADCSSLHIIRDGISFIALPKQRSHIDSLTI